MRAIFLIAVLLIFPAALAFSEDVPLIKKDCGTCHESHLMGGGVLLKEPLSGLCIGCHPDRVKADHAVDIVPSMPVEGLPLDKDGRMTCATCHDPHGKTGIERMLRDWPEELCNRCHKK